MRIVISILFFTILFTQIHCFASFKPRPIQACFKIHGMPGNEDLALHRAKKMLYISSHNRRNFMELGKIFSIDLSKPDAELRPKTLTANYPPNFRPHGMSLVEGSGKEKLYVISHTTQEDDAHTVEVFEIDGENFSHINTMKNPNLNSPNDLFALPDGRIFVSNDHGPGGAISQKMDDIFKRKRSKIAYFDGKDWWSLGPGVAFGNGIFYRKEGEREFIYQSAFMSSAVIKFELIQDTNGKPDLKEVERFDIGSGPDNLELDVDGKIFLTAHPSVFRFLRHVSSAENFSPTQAFKIDPEKKTIEEIYANEGEEISAGSTALPFNKRLILSQVFEDFLLICPMQEK